MDKVEDIVGRYAAKCREMADNGDDPRFEWWDGLADLIQSQQALIEEMREALYLSAEALDLAADEVDAWGAYAAEYFQEKHDLPGCVKEVRDAANAARKALSQKE